MSFYDLGLSVALLLLLWDHWRLRRTVLVVGKSTLAANEILKHHLIRHKKNLL